MMLTALADKLGGETLWNYIGYVASVIVLISFLMTSVVKLRWVSAIGSLVFSIYGFMIGSIPTGILNAGVVLVNAYHLAQMERKVDLFTAHQISAENDFVKDFILYYGRDIQMTFGGYTMEEMQVNTAVLVYCNMTVAGLLIGQDCGEDVLKIHLDYVTPEYRDCRVGNFLYRKLAKMGFHKLMAETDHETHIQYLKEMGFEEQNGTFVKEI